MDEDELLRLVRERIRNRQDTQASLARLVGIHPTAFSKLLTGKRQLKAKEADTLRKFLGLRDQERVPRLLPIVGLVAAGSWREGFENIVGYMPSPDPALGKNAFVVVIEGDSMDLVAKDGEAIIVDPDDLELVSGRYYIIRNSAGESTFKQYREGPARLEPCSSNEDHGTIYPGQEDFHVVGRAKKKVTDL